MTRKKKLEPVLAELLGAPSDRLSFVCPARRPRVLLLTSTDVFATAWRHEVSPGGVLVCTLHGALSARAALFLRRLIQRWKLRVLFSGNVAAYDYALFISLKRAGFAVRYAGIDDRWDVVAPGPSMYRYRSVGAHRVSGSPNARKALEAIHALAVDEGIRPTPGGTWMGVEIHAEAVLPWGDRSQARRVARWFEREFDAAGARPWPPVDHRSHARLARRWRSVRHRFDDADLFVDDVSIPFDLRVGSPGHGVVFAEKQALLLRIMGDAGLGQATLVGAFGQGRTLFELFREVQRWARSPAIYAGDADPAGLMNFAAFRAQDPDFPMRPRAGAKFTWGGVNSKWAEGIPETRFGTLNAANRRLMRWVRVFVPEYRALVGDALAEQLDRGRRLEIEALASRGMSYVLKRVRAELSRALSADRRRGTRGRR